MLFQSKPIEPVQPLRLERCMVVKNKDVAYLDGAVGVQTYPLPKWSANTSTDELTLVVIDEIQTGEQFAQSVIADLLPDSVADHQTRGWMLVRRYGDNLIHDKGSPWDTFDFSQISVLAA